MIIQELTEEVVRNNDFIGINIPKRDIKKLDFKYINHNMKILNKVGKKAKGKVYLAFDGYDDVKEEIYEINEIRKWMKIFSIKYPHFLYFINTVLDNHVSLLGTLCDVEAVSFGEPPLSPIEYGKRGINPLSLPKIQIHLKMDEENKDKLINGLVKYGDTINDKEGVQVLIYMLNKIISI